MTNLTEQLIKENKELEKRNFDLHKLISGLNEENKRLKHDVGNLCYKIKNQRHEIENRLKGIKQLKELLKECIIYVDRYVAFSVVQGNEEREVKSKELLTKINQVLREE